MTKKAREVLTWPPKVGSRFCRDYGPGNQNNYSAEVRAVVDDDYAVVKRWRKHKGWHVYEILDRQTLEVFNRDAKCFFVGPLPRASQVKR